ncbi:SDR family NAD(P)-dependent oxidoreductase [Kitasatospora sp. NPDC091335]|uniref:SDR family NAD(P)-dependent oxidoreductase n=1 Tax=Kitasatospora sp. NPDC091335 TaxID=3364085 RepID=UPI0037FBC417
MSVDRHTATAGSPPGRHERDQGGEPVAIVGVGLRFPGGSTSFDEFEEFLRTGSSGIGPLPEDRWDVAAFTPQGPDDKGKIRARGGGYLDRIDLFDAGFFNISPKEAQYIDPQQRMLLETAWQALEHANIDPTLLRRGNGGVYIGASSVDYALELDSLPYEELDGHLASGITLFPLAGRLSYFLGWQGPSISVDTACSSSLAALHMAVTALRRGECDIALSGGVNALHHPRIPVMFSNAQMLAADGQCKTFDESADGYARAEGVGVIVLKRLADATRDGDDVLAVIRGTAVGQDGDSAGLTVPNGPAQERVLKLALADAGLTPGDVQYVEAHGTGTPLGDPIEIGAISNVFADTRTKDDPLIVGSVKTNLGHMEPASGLVGVIKVLLQLRSGTIYPHLNFTTPSSRIPWEVYPVRVPTACESWQAPVRRAAVNSFGFAGTIGAVVLEQPPARALGARSADGAQTVTHGASPLFTLSAKSAAALREQAERYRQFVTERPDSDIARLSYTANVGRAHFTYRVAALLTSREDLLKVLDTVRQPDRTIEPSGVRKVAFTFTGQGAQYPGMGAAPYVRFPLFRDTVDECDRLFAAHLDVSVRELLLGTADDPDTIHQTLCAQASLFTLEYALAKLWMSWGVKPNVLLGHSIGEVVAAAVAGLFSLPDAVTLVAVRARLMQSVTAPGGMASVSAPAERVEPFLQGHEDLAVAAVNGPQTCVVSGGSESLRAVSEQLAANGIRVQPLAVSHAFHSPLMAEVFDEFRAALDGISFREPSISLVSNLTGKVARMREIGGPDYWVRHIGRPVQFMAGMRAVARRGRHAFVELGPSGMLTALGKNCVPADEHVWLASLRRQDTTGTATLHALADLYAAGLPVDWAAYHAGHAPAKQQLPTYAFQRKPYWLPAVKARTRRAAGPASHPLLGQSTPTAELPEGTREFTTDFTPDDIGEAIVGHRLASQATLPPAAWADLLLALQDAVLGHTRATVADLRLPEPLPLPDEGVVRLTTRLRHADEGAMDVEVTGLTEGAEGGQGQERTYVRARILPRTQPGTGPDSGLLALVAGPGSILAEADGADIATDLAAVDRGFTDDEPHITRVTRHDGGVVTAELAGCAATAVEQLPAVLLESALQAAVATDDEGPVFVLQGARGVRLFKKPRGERLRAVARVRRDGAGRLADLLLLDGSGPEPAEPVAEILGAVLARPHGADAGPHFTHRLGWPRHSLPAVTTDTPQRHVVIPGADDAVRPAVLAALTAHGPAAGVRVSTVPNAQALREALAEHPSVTDVAWFWRPGPGEMSYDRLHAESEANFTELLDVVAAADSRPARRAPRVWLITERAQWLPGDRADGTEQIAATSLWGFGHVLLNEHPHLKATLIDLDAPADGADQAVAAALLAEWRAQEKDEYQIGYRAGQRHVRRLLAGDETPAWQGTFEVRAPASGDLDKFAVTAGQTAEHPPQGDEVRVSVTAAALTRRDFPTAVDAEGEHETVPVTATAYAGTVLAAGPAATHTVGTEVTVHHHGPLASTLTVPSTAVTPRAAQDTDPATAAARAAGGSAASPDVYGQDEVDEALRVLSTGADVTVVTLGADRPGGAAAPSAQAAAPAIRPDRTYVITGGLGGLGLVTARMLVDLGARHLALVSRRGRATEEAADVLAALEERADIALLRADTGSADDVARLVTDLASLPHPVGGLVHAAGAIGTGLISELTWEAIHEQLAPKAYGGWLLHQAATSFPDLDFFTVYSSIASVAAVRGGVGQARYAAANAFLDGLAHLRVHQGLPGLAVNWGSWARVGMSARLDTSYIQEIERSGVRFFSPSWALRTLHRLWGLPNAGQRIVNRFDWPVFAGRLPQTNALYARVTDPAGTAAGDAGLDLADLLSRPGPERLKLIGQTVAERLAKVLHFGSVDELDPVADFITLGLDSVMGMEVKSGLESDFGLTLPSSLTFDCPSVRHITAFVESQITQDAV